MLSPAAAAESTPTVDHLSIYCAAHLSFSISYSGHDLNEPLKTTAEVYLIR